MNNPIYHAFRPIHASDGTLEEVFQRIESKRHRFCFSVRILLAAVLAFILLTLSVFAADYVLNHRQVFFFDTLEALAAKQSQENPGNAIGYAIPCDAEEAKDLETSVQYVARAMENGLLGDEQVVDQGETPDGRWVIRKCQNDLYGDVITEYRTSPTYANALSIDGLLQWDLSALANTMKPDENGQILVLCKSQEEHDLLWSKAHLGYTTDEGKRFSLSYTYDITWDYGRPEYILSDAYDSSEVFVTDDSVQVLLLSYDGQVWANAANGHRSVDIYTTGRTVSEIKSLLNQLSLSTVLE